MLTHRHSSTHVHHDVRHLKSQLIHLIFVLLFILEVCAFNSFKKRHVFHDNMPQGQTISLSSLFNGISTVVAYFPHSLADKGVHTFPVRHLSESERYFATGVRTRLLRCHPPVL